MARMSGRRYFLKTTLGAAALSLPALGKPAAGAGKRPNILLAIADDPGSFARAWLTGRIKAEASVFDLLRLRKLLSGNAVLGFHRLIEPVSILPKRIVLLILTVGYVAVIGWAGFTITSFVFLFLAITALGGRRYGLNLMIAAAFSIGGWLLFDVAFQAQLPAGPFEALMKGFM